MSLRARTCWMMVWVERSLQALLGKGLLGKVSGSGQMGAGSRKLGLSGVVLGVAFEVVFMVFPGFGVRKTKKNLAPLTCQKSGGLRSSTTTSLTGVNSVRGELSVLVAPNADSAKFFRRLGCCGLAA